ncbi:hypothetical protein D4R89_06560 [bacterium]|nr:MAG: hypothetical protein D4R89_06560 [bacterium]
MRKGFAPGSDKESPETRVLLGSSGPRLQAYLISCRKPILGALGHRRPAAALVGHSSQADLRMVAAALPHVLLIMKNKGRKSIIKQKKPA